MNISVGTDAATKITYEGKSINVSFIDKCNTALLSVPFIVKENWGANTTVDPSVDYKVYVGLPHILFFAQGIVTVDPLYASFTTC